MWRQPRSVHGLVAPQSDSWKWARLQDGILLQSRRSRALTYLTVPQTPRLQLMSSLKQVLLANCSIPSFCRHPEPLHEAQDPSPPSRFAPGRAPETRPTARHPAPARSASPSPAPQLRTPAVGARRHTATRYRHHRTPPAGSWAASASPDPPRRRVCSGRSRPEAGRVSARSPPPETAATGQAEGRQVFRESGAFCRGGVGCASFSSSLSTRTRQWRQCSGYRPVSWRRMICWECHPLRMMPLRIHCSGSVSASLRLLKTAVSLFSQRPDLTPTRRPSCQFLSTRYHY